MGKIKQPKHTSRSRVGCVALFDMNAVKMDSPRIVEIKKHDIQTHHAPHCEEPWLAIPMNLARERLKGFEPHDEPLTSPASITASYGAILDDEGLTFFGHSETEVQDAALQFLQSNVKANHPLEVAEENENK